MLASVLEPLIIIAALALAYANGANANFKGVASLFGSGTVGYWGAVKWATVTTAAGCLVAVWASGSLLAAFTGKGLVPSELAAEPRFLFAVAAGAGLANLAATRLGFPVSTTHLLLGGLLGAGLGARPEAVNFQRLWEAFVRPLLLAPVLAIALGSALYHGLKLLRWVPEARNRTLDVLHFLSGGAVCFARGLTEPPAVATWRESDAIGNQVAPIGSLLRHVLEEKHAADAVGLAEYALERIAELSMGTQDSEVWSVPLLDDVGELHRKACLEARPDPVLLARRWKRFRGRWSFPVFDRFPAAYEQILGPDGLNEWQRRG